MERVFNTSPFGCSWTLCKETLLDAKQGITIENWIGMWLKHINNDPLIAFRDIYYIGYCGQMKDAIVPLQFRPREVNGASALRRFFTVALVGAKNCGKTTFMRRFLESEQVNTSCVKAFQCGDKVKYLHLSEFADF